MKYQSSESCVLSHTHLCDWIVLANHLQYLVMFSFLSHFMSLRVTAHATPILASRRVCRQWIQDTVSIVCTGDILHGKSLATFMRCSASLCAVHVGPPNPVSEETVSGPAPSLADKLERRLPSMRTHRPSTSLSPNRWDKLRVVRQPQNSQAICVVIGVWAAISCANGQ